MAQTAEQKKKTRILPVLRAYYRAAAKYPWLLGLTFLGGLIIEGASVSGSLVMRHLIDLLSLPGAKEQIGTAALITVLAFGGAALLGWVGQRLRQIGLTYIEPKVMNDLMRSAFEYLLRHSHDFFSSNFAGTLTRRVTRYGRSFESVLDNISFNFFATLVYGTSVLVILSLRSPLLGLIVLVWTIIFIYVQVAMARWRQPLRIARADEDSKVTGVLSDAIGNYSAIHLFATEKRELSLFEAATERWRVATMRSWIADNWIWAIQGLFVIAIEIGLLGAGIYLWQRGVFSVGDFVLVQLYIIGLIDRIWNIGNAMRQLYDAFADAYEMVEIMETAHGIQDKPNARALTFTEGKVSFDAVAFAFANGRPILNDFTLTIEPRQKVALVGPSGAGKSTVTKLLMRIHDVTGGAIRVDGQDIRDITQESLRSTISFVPQEPVLFHRSFAENIAYGKPEATQEEIIEAAKKAHCHDFVAALPEGYETHVGERGVKLSGGERQRVAIARAILKNAPILVLDEATSALDSESESLIQDALKTLMEGKTVVVIAHRLSTIMKMDRIVVIEDGAIAADGTHDELLKEEGLYHKLWNIQAGSFITDQQSTA